MLRHVIFGFPQPGLPVRVLLGDIGVDGFLQLRRCQFVLGVGHQQVQVLGELVVLLDVLLDVGLQILDTTLDGAQNDAGLFGLAIRFQLRGQRERQLRTRTCADGRFDDTGVRIVEPALPGVKLLAIVLRNLLREGLRVRCVTQGAHDLGQVGECRRAAVVGIDTGDLLYRRHALLDDLRGLLRG